MKKKAIKIFIAIIFFLIELGLPVCLYASYFFISRAYDSYQLNKYDINKDGIWSKDEQVGDYQYWADACHSGDGARCVFFIYFSCGSVFLGVLYKIIFFCGDTLKDYIYIKKSVHYKEDHEDIEKAHLEGYPN